jgi:hypothetical protein
VNFLYSQADERPIFNFLRNPQKNIFPGFQLSENTSSLPIERLPNYFIRKIKPMHVGTGSRGDPALDFNNPEYRPSSCFAALPPRNAAATPRRHR